jgi:hypothetical protein
MEAIRTAAERLAGTGSGPGRETSRPAGLHGVALQTIASTPRLTVEAAATC